ncbi:MAG: LLM class flavin-dependent oxidoreductase [Chromatiales bacterium]|jgi:5,10-methylenetetrahydromethanopterin reductase|nr:LLM class flavin-dependent oxidoreductase [Chromatiales bacterium]
MTEFWTIAYPLPGTPERTAQLAEARGWDGLLFTDSQNHNGDCYAALAIAAKSTKRIGLGTGVTNPYTRHAAVTASAIASIQVESDGRAVLGIGRGDSAVARLGLRPTPLEKFATYLTDLQRYLGGDEVTNNGYTAPIRWLAQQTAPGRPQAKVPVDVAATGPKVIEIAGRQADILTFAVGADTKRMVSGVERARRAREAAGRDVETLKFGAYINIAAHTDPAVARQASIGSVGIIAHFSGMGKTALEQLAPNDRAVIEALTRDYQLDSHGDARATHIEHLSDEFVGRFAIVGTPTQCVDRLGTLLEEVPLSRVVVMNNSRGVDPAILEEVSMAVSEEVLPAVRG